MFRFLRDIRFPPGWISSDKSSVKDERFAIYNVYKLFENEYILYFRVIPK